MDAAIRDRLAAPIAYDWWWGVLGVVLLLGALAWSCVLVHAARRRRAQSTREQLGALPTLRADCARRVDDIEQALARRELTPRDAALQLAALARTWVVAVTDDAPRQLHAATALELEQHGFDALARAVSASYPPAFARAEQDVTDLVVEVRKLLDS